MIKQFTFSILLMFAAFVSFGQAEAETADDVHTASQKYLDLLLSDDFATLAEMTYPSIVAMGGGIEYFIENAKADKEQLKDSGLITKEVVVQTAGDPIATKDGIIILVPYKWNVTFGSGLFTSTAYILASTKDDGKTWTFVNLQKHTSESLRIFLPQIPEDFEVPMATPFEELRN